MNQLTFEDAVPLSSHQLFRDLSPHVVEKFMIYHKANPQVFRLFKRFSNELKSSGRDYYGAKSIAERIRWHTGVETKGEEFKLGNNHISCYSRLLMIEDPSFIGFFRTRKSV